MAAPDKQNTPLRNAGGLDHPLVLGVEHLSHVPQLHGLVLAVGDEVVPVSLGSDARNPRLVSAETPHLWVCMEIGAKRGELVYFSITVRCEGCCYVRIEEMLEQPSVQSFCAIQMREI